MAQQNLLSAGLFTFSVAATNVFPVERPQSGMNTLPIEGSPSVSNMFEQRGVQQGQTFTQSVTSVTHCFQFQPTSAQVQPSCSQFQSV